MFGLEEELMHKASLARKLAAKRRKERDEILRALRFLIDAHDGKGSRQLADDRARMMVYKYRNIK